MKIILIQDHPKLGPKGTIVEVADGYARNYLIPQKFAIPATPSNLKAFQEVQRQQQQKEAKRRERAEKLAKKLSKVKIAIALRTGEEGKVFGSVGTQDIARALQERGFPEIDKHMVVLEEPLKELGTFYVPIRLHPEVTAQVKVEIEPQQ